MSIAQLDAALVDRLVQQARLARQRAYAPYSRFQVGAALLLDDGRVVLGCNVENASYGLSLCAERNAVTTAVAEGVRRFAALAVLAEGASPPRPCGLCLQMLAEFCVDLPLVLANVEGVCERTHLGALLPQPFRCEGATGGRPM